MKRGFEKKNNKRIEKFLLLSVELSSSFSFISLGVYTFVSADLFWWLMLTKQSGTFSSSLLSSNPLPQPVISFSNHSLFIFLFGVLQYLLSSIPTIFWFVSRDCLNSSPTFYSDFFFYRSSACVYNIHSFLMMFLVIELFMLMESCDMVFHAFLR